MRRELAVVEHARVDLVGEHPGVCVRDQAGRLGEVVAPARRRRSDSAGELRMTSFVRGPSRSARSAGSKVKSRSSRSGSGTGRRADPADRRLVDREARVGVDHLVARIADGEDREEEERLRARSRRARCSGRPRVRASRERSSAIDLAELDEAGARAVVRLPGPHAPRTPPRRCAPACRSRARRSRGG